jgi:hypothetical protein
MLNFRIAIIGFCASLLFACSLLSSPTPSPTPQNSAPTEAAAIPTGTATPEGTIYLSNHVRLVIPPGLATGANSNLSTDLEYPYINGDESMPTHVVITLNGYSLPENTWHPRIMVFQTEEFSQFDDLTRILVESVRALPNHPDAKDNKSIHTHFYAQWKILESNAGSGARFLTQILTGYGHIYNDYIFYCYMGLSKDGSHFMMVTSPVKVAFLESAKETKALPEGGIPFPASAGEKGELISQYYQAVMDKLNATLPEAYTPSLLLLDKLAESIEYVP